MSHALEGKLVLDVFLNGTAIPFGPRLTLNYLHMSTSRRQILPYLSFSVVDNGQWMVGNGLLGDGVIIQVKIQVGSQTTLVDHTFLMSFVDEKREGGNIAYVIEGSLNKPRFLSGSTEGAVRGTSSSVLSQIARVCELGFEGVGTDDSQVWYGTNRRYHQFAQDICRHGYVNSASCMQYSITMNGVLRYLDLSSMGVPTATLGLLQVGTPGVLPVVGFHPVASTGGSNVTTGYSMATIEQNLMSADGMFIRQDSVRSVINEPGQISISADVRLRVGQGIVSFGPLDPGNCHPQYIRAAHQNLRAGNLFSSFLEVTLAQVSNIEPLDTVTVSTDVLHDQGYQQYDAKSYAGSYRVFDKVIYVYQTTYYEKLVLGRRTTATSKSASSVVKGSTGSVPVSVSQTLTVSQSSVVGTPPQSPAFFLSTIASVSGALTAAISARSSAATSASAGATAVIADPLKDVSAQLTLVRGDVDTAKLAAISAVADFKALNSPGSPPTYFDDLTALITGQKALIAAAIAARLPAVEKAAPKSLSIGTVATKINASASALGSLTPPSTAPLTAIAGLTTSPAVFAAANSASLAANSAASAASSAVTAATSVATAHATTLTTDATTFSTQIDAYRDAAYAELDALNF